MPPPPTHVQQRREMQSRAPALPTPGITQHQETYNRAPNVSTSSYTERELGHARRPAESRALDLSNPPIRLHPIIRNQPYRAHGDHMDGPIVNDQHIAYPTINRPLEPAYGVAQRSPFVQQNYASQPIESQLFVRKGQPTYTVDITDEQQHQPRRTREPLQPIHVNGIGQQTPKRSSYLNTTPKVSLLRASQQTAGSISSPFFQREGTTSHIASTRRPPPRGGDVSQTREQRGLHVGATTRPQWLYGAKNVSLAQDSYDRFELPTRPQPPSGYGTFERAPSSTALPYRGMTTTSQMSSDLKPRDNRHAHAYPSRQPLDERPLIPASRGRITLPPSKSSSQDYELSSIRGLRGGYPHRPEGFSSQQNSGYTGSRPLFTAASRRSVRR